MFVHLKISLLLATFSLTLDILKPISKMKCLQFLALGTWLLELLHIHSCQISEYCHSTGLFCNPNIYFKLIYLFIVDKVLVFHVLDGLGSILQTKAENSVYWYQWRYKLYSKMLHSGLYSCKVLDLVYMPLHILSLSVTLAAKWYTPEMSLKLRQGHLFSGI